MFTKLQQSVGAFLYIKRWLHGICYSTGEFALFTLYLVATKWGFFCDFFHSAKGQIWWFSMIQLCLLRSRLRKLKTWPLSLSLLLCRRTYNQCFVKDLIELLRNTGFRGSFGTFWGSSESLSFTAHPHTNQGQFVLQKQFTNVSIVMEWYLFISLDNP